MDRYNELMEQVAHAGTRDDDAPGQTYIRVPSDVQQVRIRGEQRELTMDELGMLLEWAARADKVQPMTTEENILRRKIFLEHTSLFLKQEFGV